MAVIWHRICFDPRDVSKRFENRDVFGAWCATHFSDFEYTTAGYSIRPVNHRVNSGGAPCWNILIPGKSVYAGEEPDIIRFLSEKHWSIDEQDIILYVKYDHEREELLYPIRGGSINIDMAKEA